MVFIVVSADQDPLARVFLARDFAEDVVRLGVFFDFAGQFQVDVEALGFGGTQRLARLVGKGMAFLYS